MGKVEKGITCSVLGCEESADRSMSLAKAKMSQDLDFDNSKNVYIYVGITIKIGKNRLRRTGKMKD